MKLNGTIFSKPQQDQLKRALENGGGGGGGSLTKHVVEMTPANYETIKNDIPKIVGASLDIETQGTHTIGHSFSFINDHIVAQAIEQYDSGLHFIGVRLNETRIIGMYYIYSPSSGSTVEFTDISNELMSGNPTFTLTYWTE